LESVFHERDSAPAVQYHHLDPIAAPSQAIPLKNTQITEQFNAFISNSEYKERDGMINGDTF
jgi:hypothetical protein